MIRAFIIWVWAVLFPVFALAQAATQDAKHEPRTRAQLDDRGYIQAFLEDNLSAVGRDIRIVGFAGALSSQATIDQITIADEKGVWLTLNKLALNLNRAAILRGALDITELSAEEIILTRKPAAVSDGPTPEATGFALPELPISIDIKKIFSPRIVIGEAVMGQAVTVSLDGEAHLAGGDGTARLLAQRVDRRQGRFEVDGRFENATRFLELKLSLDEAADGVAVNLLGLPDRPTVKMAVVGSGPLSDFRADVTLATDGQDRLTGEVELIDDSKGTTAGEQRFRANLTGDIAPVLLPEYRTFFGDNITLTAEGRRRVDGVLQLEKMDLDTHALRLSGNLHLSPDGWPLRFALTGRIADASGAPVLLPLTGPKTYVKGADLRLSFDADVSDDWTLQMAMADLSRPDMKANLVQLTGRGQLVSGAGVATGQVAGDLTFAAKGLSPTDPALARALGPVISGGLQLDWQEGGRLQVDDLRLTGADYNLAGALTIDDLAKGGFVETRPGLILRAEDLARFSDLAGLDLRGAAELSLQGNANLLGGAFDLSLTGSGMDLALSQPRIDPLLAGQTRLNITAVRDADGTRLPLMEVFSDQAQIRISADLKTDASRAEFSAKIIDARVVDPGLSGPVNLDGDVVQAGDVWTLRAKGAGPGGADLDFNGEVLTAEGTPQRITGRITGKLVQLSAYRSLIGQSVSGGLDLTADGEMDLQTNAFTVALNGTGQNLAIGNSMLDPLSAGQSKLTLRAHRTDKGVVLLDQLNLNTREVTLSATGERANGRDIIRFDGRLRNLGVLADGVTGPASARGTATLLGEKWQLNVAGQGPNDANVTVDGTVASDGKRANLTIKGSTHLAFVNPLIRPRLLSGLARLDLALNGPIALSSLSGEVKVTEGQFILPNLNIALNLDQFVTRLANGRAQVSARTSVTTGGQVTAQGGISLSSPFDANVQMVATGVKLSDGNLYDTVVDGQVQLGGPLAGGAAIRGALALGATEIRVPEAGPSSVPIMAELEHVNEPAAVRRTRRDAGLISDDGTTATGRPYPLDIAISAPSRIFVRGRGLDAELGGQLRLTGTSSDIIPQGRFELVRGRLDILGKRLNLTTGQVSLRGSFDPRLFFVAQSETDDAVVQITVEGPASEPEVTFSANPDLPQDEVLARLLFGRNITEISPLQALRMAAAIRTLAGKGGEGVIGELRGSFGLDDLDVSTDAAGVTNVSVGKYISENIYTDITVGSDGSSEVNLNLNISPSVKARGSVGSYGESTLGIYFERDY